MFFTTAEKGQADSKPMGWGYCPWLMQCRATIGQYTAASICASSQDLTRSADSR